MKQTTLQWLGFELNMLFTDITEEQWNRADKIFKQAKEMEKQQQGYSEEDMNQYSEYTLMCSAEKTLKIPLPPKQWFEQFKNK
jgi:hypothetical protein